VARQRLREARILLDNGFAPGAYYLAGYAVECALKACIARKTLRHEFPNLDTVKKSWTHDLTQLVRTAGLEVECRKLQESRREFKINWAIVKDWNEDSRYDVGVNSQKARDLYRAITNRGNGVFPWVRRHW
jgi:HEPN domain-containing protein